MFFLCYSLMHHKNPGEIFPYDAPLLPNGILGKLTLPLPPGKSDPFCEGGMDIFWNHTIELYKLTYITAIESRGVASFSNSFRPDWFSFPHNYSENFTYDQYTLTSPTLWALKLFSSPQQRIIYCNWVEWSIQKFVGPDLQVYGLAMPLQNIL